MTPAAPAMTTTVLFRRGDQIPLKPPPKYPMVRHRKHGLVLVLEPRRECDIPADPIRLLGLLHHLSAKTWADGRWVHLAIERIAEARGWQLY